MVTSPPILVTLGVPRGQSPDQGWISTPLGAPYFIALHRIYRVPEALKSLRHSVTRADMVFSPSRTQTYDN